MSTAAIANSSSSSASSGVSSNRKQLKTEDFIKMMLTQLQHQDPTNPTKDSDLLAQMSQIGQLQSADTTQKSLQQMTSAFQETMGSMLLQGQIGAAGNLIGMKVQGMDSSGKAVTGLVTSVKVDPRTRAVDLELDNGKKLGLANVTNIAGW